MPRRAPDRFRGFACKCSPPAAGRRPGDAAKQPQGSRSYWSRFALRHRALQELLQFPYPFGILKEHAAGGTDFVSDRLKITRIRAEPERLFDVFLLTVGH